MSLPAKMNSDSHVGRFVSKGGVDEFDILLGELLDVLSSFFGSFAHFFAAQVGEVRVIQLDVFAL